MRHNAVSPVLVGCEESQTICRVFREAGYEAYSCDLEPTRGNPNWHYQQDISAVVYTGKRQHSAKRQGHDMQKKKVSVGDVLTTIKGGSKYRITHINGIAVELQHIRLESRWVVHASELSKIFSAA